MDISFSRYKSTLHLVEGHGHHLYIESEKQMNLIPVSRHCWFQYGSLSVISINSMVLNNQVAAADKMSANDMMIEQVFSKSVLASRMQSWVGKWSHTEGVNIRVYFVKLPVATYTAYLHDYKLS